MSLAIQEGDDILSIWFFSPEWRVCSFSQNKICQSSLRRGPAVTVLFHTEAYPSKVAPDVVTFSRGLRAGDQDHTPTASMGML